jgi:hypothetical protein
LIQEILNSELTEEQKNDLIGKIYANGTITSGLYLRKDEATGDFQCWFRNVDENGMTDHGPTDYSPAEIIAEYKRSLGNRL